jgi:hypothetical protein
MATPKNTVRMMKSPKSAAVSVTAVPMITAHQAPTPLLAGRRRPGVSFRLPPKLAGAVEYCRRRADAGVDRTTFAGRFGRQAAGTLLLLGFLEWGADGQFRYASAADEWMDAHHRYRAGPELPSSRQSDNLCAERERQALKLCQRRRSYESITKVCGDVSTLHLIEEDLLEWVSWPAEGKQRPWKLGQAQLQLTDTGHEFLAGQR